MKFSFLASSAVSTLATAEVDLSELGTNDLSVYNYEMETTVDENCDYTLTVKYSHPEDFPIGGPNACAPWGVNAPEPGDGLPCLMGRSYWGDRFPKDVRDATAGLDHPSLDWNACGHPDDGFLTPHCTTCTFTPYLPLFGPLTCFAI
jgi:hypothetical protein